MPTIGLIQPNPTPGFFPGNLRAIVELYRFCLDRDAELVLCPAYALSGQFPGNLAQRSGFIAQREAALCYLSREMSGVPLILAEDDELGNLHLFRFCADDASCLFTIPCHERSSTSAFLLNTTNKSLELRPFDGYLPQESTDSSLLLRLTFSPWKLGLTEKDESLARQTALQSGVPVATLRLAGAESALLHPGASSLYSPAACCGRLAAFTQDFGVFSPGTPSGTEDFSESNVGQLRRAILTACSDVAHKQRIRRIYLNTNESPYAEPLAAFLQAHLPELDIIPVREECEALRSRVDDEGALWFSAIDRVAILTNKRAVRRAGFCDFAPIGDLYPSELARFLPSAPNLPDEDDSILQAIDRRHISPTHLVTRFPKKEDMIRKRQRQMHTTERERHHLPPLLALLNSPDAHLVPSVHRLSD